MKRAVPLPPAPARVAGAWKGDGVDHLFVGISAQTGKILWTGPFPY